MQTFKFKDYSLSVKLNLLELKKLFLRLIFEF